MAKIKRRHRPLVAPKPLKPLKSLRWRRETTTSESEFAVRRIWTSKGGNYQILEATYKEPYKYTKRYLALWFNGTCFQMVSNGHKKRPWAKRACEAWNRMLYAKGEQRYAEALKKYEQALKRQADRDAEDRRFDAQQARKEKRAADAAAKASAAAADAGVVCSPAAKARVVAKAGASPARAAKAKSGHADKPKARRTKTS